MSEPSKLADPDRRYFAWRASHPNMGADPRAAWAEAWRQAYWAGVRENAALGLDLLSLVQRVQALEQRLRDHQVNAEVDRELERSSVYWRTEAAEELPSPCELDPDHEFHQHEVKRDA